MLSAPGIQRLGNGQYAAADDLSVRFMWPTRHAPGSQALRSIDHEIGTSLPRLPHCRFGRLLFLALSRVAAKIHRAPPGGPRGRALHRKARGLLCFDLPRCTVPMFLMPSVQLPLRLPKRISALFDPPLLFQIHPRPHTLRSIAVQPNLCLLPLQNTPRPPRAAARREHTDG
jgi:hypothetical protein